MFSKRSLALALCLVLSGAFGAVARAQPSLPLGHWGRWITDASGRVVIVHGINMVYKLPPYYPAAVGFDGDDAAFLTRIGFNAVRVGVIWKALEPQPGIYDAAYLRHIAATVRMLGRHHILSLLDFHQDLYNERFQGEGAPNWAVQDGGLPNPRNGFPDNYVSNPALEHALDRFFGNARGPGGVGLAARFAAVWGQVAAGFSGRRGLLGYELFNEPFPGTQWEACANTAGCPFDAKLTALYRRVASAIRTHDLRTLIFYEPNVLFNYGAGSQIKPLGDRGRGFAFHDYCLQEPNTTSCDKLDDRVFQNATGRIAATHEALLLTEFGATNDAAYLNHMLARADRFMVPWIEWAYCGCHDPTTTGPGAKQAIVRNPAKPPRGANLVLGTLRALVEPFPQVIAGTPLSWSYDRRRRDFSLRYSTARVQGHGRFSAGAITEVALPALVYGGRYKVQVSGGRVVSPAGAGLLRVAERAGASRVSVTVLPT